MEFQFNQIMEDDAIMRRQRISRAISLLAALLIPVCMTSGAFAEDYSSLSLDELTEMRNSINVEIRERKEAQEAENALQFTSADDFGYVDNGSEVMIRSCLSNEYQDMSALLDAYEE